MKRTLAHILLPIGVFLATVILSLFFRFILAVLIGVFSSLMTSSQINVLFWLIQIVTLAVVMVVVWKRTGSLASVVAMLLGFLVGLGVGPMD